MMAGGSAQGPWARTQIKKLVGGSVTLHPTDEGYLEAEMRGDYAGLIRLLEESPGKRRSRASELSLVAGARNHLYRTVILWFSRRALCR